MAHIIEKLTRLEYNSLSHRCFDVSWDFLDGTTYEAATLPIGAIEKALAGPLSTKLSFSEHLVGSGSAGTAAPVAYLLKRCCGLKQTNTPSTSDVLEADGLLVAGANSSLATTIDQYVGNAVKNSMTNAVGNAQFQFRPGEVAKVMFDLVGLYAAQTEAAGSAAQATIATPYVQKSQTITVASDALSVKEVDIDLGNETNGPFLDISSNATQGVLAPVLINQKPTMRILAIRPAFSVENYETDFLANTGHAISMAPAAGAAGNILTITGTGYLTAPPAYSIVDGVMAVELNYMFKFDANPLTFSFT